MEHFGHRLLAYLWFLEFLIVEWEAEPSCETGRLALLLRLGLKLSSLMKCIVTTSSDDPGPSLSYAAKGLGCWWTSHNALRISYPHPCSCVYTPLLHLQIFDFFFRVRNGEFSLFFFPLPNRRQWGQRSTLVMHHFQQHETDLYPKLYFSIVKRSRVGMHELEVEMGTSFEGEQEYHSCIFLLRAAVEYDFLRFSEVRSSTGAPVSSMLPFGCSPFTLHPYKEKK